MIIFLGIAGAGKGTQAALLAEKLNCVQLSSGELLRSHANDPEIKATLAKGNLVSDEVLLPIFEEEINKASGQELILDGFPRTTDQAQWLMDKFSIRAVINLQLSKGTAKRRLLERGRGDDTEEAIDQRFREYEKKVLPIADYFRHHGIDVHDIDADQTVDEVAESINQALHIDEA